jgi:hypothetical protein
MSKTQKLPCEYSSVHVSYTKDNSPKRSLAPPTDQIVGKLLSFKSWVARVGDYKDNSCYLDIWARRKNNKFGPESFTTFTDKELLNIKPNSGDVLFIWEWRELRQEIKITRIHIECESRILTDAERQKCRDLAKELEKEILERDALNKGE